MHPSTTPASSVVPREHTYTSAGPRSFYSKATIAFKSHIADCMCSSQVHLGKVTSASEQCSEDTSTATESYWPRPNIRHTPTSNMYNRTAVQEWYYAGSQDFRNRHMTCTGQYQLCTSRSCWLDHQLCTGVHSRGKVDGVQQYGCTRVYSRTAG